MPQAKRKAAKIDPQELWSMFLKKIQDEDDADGFDRYSISEVDKIGKDISKVQFDFENCEFGPYPDIDDALNGLRSTYVSGGNLSFIGVSAGGDWEYPVYFIIYLDQDGKTFRGYIPKDGNTWNYDTKEALGNDEEADEKFLRKFAKKNDIVLDETMTIGLDDGDMMSSNLMIQRDIYARIEVI